MWVNPQQNTWLVVSISSQPRRSLKTFYKRDALKRSILKLIQKSKSDINSFSIRLSLAKYIRGGSDISKCLLIFGSIANKRCWLYSNSHWRHWRRSSSYNNSFYGEFDKEMQNRTNILFYLSFLLHFILLLACSLAKVSYSWSTPWHWLLPNQFSSKLVRNKEFLAQNESKPKSHTK